MNILDVSLVLGFFIAAIMFLSGIISLYEKEWQASVMSFFGGVVLSVPFFVPLFLSEFWAYNYSIIIVIITVLVVAVMFYNPKKERFAPVQPFKRHDERQTMFSRRELVPGTPAFVEYYRQHPAHQPVDDAWRQSPGLLDPKSLFYHPPSYAAAEASFFTIAGLGSQIKGNVKKRQKDFNDRKLSRFIKKWMKKQGVKDVGITPMQDYHYYHTKGRGATYNQSVTPKYKNGIALTVEMDETMMKAAPRGAAVMESGEQYLKSGVPAVQLAAFLRELGYPAQAHIDGNYEVVCPLVARDAGLGEIGRMGLLMTPRQGPRVRIAVVTTDASLVYDKPTDLAYSMNEFCTYCKKCATACPGKAISFDDRMQHDDGLRWKINSETCFSYWQISGTDCGRCMAVCPYAHANNIMHNAVRFGVRYSKLFRRLALWMDDIFYGTKPKIRKMPEWVNL